MIDVEFAQKVMGLIKDRSASDVNRALLFTLATVVYDSEQNHDLALTTLDATLVVSDLLGTIPSEHTVSRAAEALAASPEPGNGEVEVVPAKANAKFTQEKRKKRVSDLRETDKVLKDDGSVAYTCLEASRRPGDGSYNVQVQMTDGDIKRMEWDEDEQNPEVDVLVAVVAPN
jgi:hypothetical protein